MYISQKLKQRFERWLLASDGRSESTAEHYAWLVNGVLQAAMMSVAHDEQYMNAGVLNRSQILGLCCLCKVPIENYMRSRSAANRRDKTRTAW